AVEFLTKPFQKEELIHAVEQAFDYDRARRQEAEELDAIHARMDSLSEREREVMGLVTAGFLNKQIAADLEVSEITVKLHRRKVMEKMHANSLADLVKMCERVKTPQRGETERS
ncbi:MAG TPA: LuxR C-terminal-related transcriptional regulator, partial [Terracidiphilus sp.]|nr:LuxR C-terminal-related transcriptional regulator [Terracidiphilus sp.]